MAAKELHQVRLVEGQAQVSSEAAAMSPISQPTGGLLLPAAGLTLRTPPAAPVVVSSGPRLPTGADPEQSRIASSSPSRQLQGMGFRSPSGMPLPPPLSSAPDYGEDLGGNLGEEDKAKDGPEDVPEAALAAPSESAPSGSPMAWWPDLDNALATLEGLREKGPVPPDGKRGASEAQATSTGAVQNGEGVSSTSNLEAAAASVGRYAKQLASMLSDESPRARSAAAAALGALGPAAAGHAGELASAMLGDPDPAVRRASSMALAQLGETATGHANAMLAVALNDGDPQVRLSAALSLGQMGQTAVLSMAGIAQGVRGTSEPRTSPA